jgi:hypothetical protein
MAMTTFADFVVELRAACPELEQPEIEAFETVLHDIECESDAMSVALFDGVLWAVNQTQYPAPVRLAFIHRCFDTAVARPTLQ